MSEEQKKVLFVVNGQNVDGLGRVDGEAPKPQAQAGADLQGQLDEKQAEINRLNAKYEGAQILPSDALKRLTDVKGIGPALAQQALDALK